jgi:mono/diheme cytochrome c family protein
MDLRELLRSGGVGLIAAGGVALAARVAIAFPWSTDMYRGSQVPALAEAPRAMPDGVLPVDGIHYNVHYGQPQGIAKQVANPPMKLEIMTVKMHNPLQPDATNLAHGKTLFETTCSPCHGMTGQGNGSVTHLLQHKPANLLTGVSKNLPDGYIYGYIRNGGVWMPSYVEAMSSDERWQVVLYVRDLQHKTATETAAVATPAPAEPEGEHRNVTDSDPTYTETGSDSP